VKGWSEPGTCSTHTQRFLPAKALLHFRYEPHEGSGCVLRGQLHLFLSSVFFGVCYTDADSESLLCALKPPAEGAELVSGGFQAGCDRVRGPHLAKKGAGDCH
jgi:hypothetical protein